MSEEIIKRIEPIGEGKEAPKSGKELPLERTQPSREHFDAALKGGKGATFVISPEAPASPIDTLRDLQRGSGVNLSQDALIAQTKNAVRQIEEIKQVLGTPNVQIKTSARQLLQSKISHIDESLKIALSKAGIEYSPTAQGNQPLRPNPIERFLGFLTDGQQKLERLGGELETMSQQGKELTPVNMLAIQVKVGQIQQELELFTSLLSKGLESIKTIMNIQV